MLQPSSLDSPDEARNTSHHEASTFQLLYMVPDVMPREIWCISLIVEGSLEVKLPTIWTDEKQSREEAERRERLEEKE